MIKSPVGKSNKSSFVFGYSSMRMVTDEEVLLYPSSSLFGDIGGSLGLFLGVSLLALGDTILDFSKKMFVFLSTGPQNYHYIDII